MNGDAQRLEVEPQSGGNTFDIELIGDKGVFDAETQGSKSVFDIEQKSDKNEFYVEKVSGNSDFDVDMIGGNSAIDVNLGSSLNVNVITGDLPYYDGEYTITPTLENQTLPTAQKVLRKNVNVEPIPYAEVSNESNGLTVTIG